MEEAYCQYALFPLLAKTFKIRKTSIVRVGGFWIKLNQEERLLLRGFPDEFPAYKVRVKALIPYVF